MNDSLDDLLRRWHTENNDLLHQQLKEIEREIATRRLVSAETVIRLYDQITALTDEILLALPEHHNAPDPHQDRRAALERERRTLEAELRAELGSRWRDIQNLKREERQLRNELRTQLLRYQRTREDYAA